MKIRWFTHKAAVTANEVRKHAHARGLSLDDSRIILEKKVGPILQYFEVDSNEWFDVPSAVYVYGGEE